MKPTFEQWVMRILLIAAVAVITILILRKVDPVTVEDKVQPHIDSIKVKRQQIDSLLLRQEELRLKLHEDSLKQSRVTVALKSKIKVLEKRLATQRPVIQVMADTVPTLQEFIAVQDSVIAGQSALIDTLEEQSWRQARTYQALLDQAETKYQLSEEIGRHLNETVAEYQKAERKHRKQKIGLKIAAGAGLVVGFLIGN